MFPFLKEEIKTKYVSLEIVEGTGKDIYLNVFRKNGDKNNPFSLPLELSDSDIAEYGMVFAEQGASIYSKEPEKRTAEIEDGAVKITIEPEDTIGMSTGAIEVRLQHDGGKPVSILVGDIRVIRSPTSRIFG